MPKLDLELDLGDAPVVQVPEPARGAPPKPTAAAMKTLAPQLELDDWPGDLEVALEGEEPPAPERAGARGAVGRGDVPPSARGSEAASPSVRGTDGTRTPPPADDTLTDEEVTALAGFGPAPFEWLPALAYTIRVVRRRRVLTALLERTRRESDEVRRRAQAEMLRMIEAVRDREGEGDEELAELLRPVVDLAAQVSVRSESLARTLEQHRADRASLAAELMARQADRDGLLPERRTAQVWVEDATESVSRLKGDLARLARDLTVAHEDATRAAGASEFAPPEHARRIKAIEVQRATVAEEVVAVERTLAERRASLAAVDRRIADAERAISDVHARTAAGERRARTEQQSGEQALRTADQDRLEVSEAVATKLVRQHPTRVTPDEHERHLQGAEDLARAARQVLLHERALHAHHPEAFRRGLLLLGGGTVLGLLLLLGLLRVLL